MRTIGAVPRPRVANIDTVPAPVKGLNDIDSIANMDPEYAIDLLNWFPRQSSLSVRPGYEVWAQGFPGTPIATLMSYAPAVDAQERLFAANNQGIFNASTQGAGPWTPVVVATVGRWSYTNYANIAGSYLVAVNGTDPGQLYDGTTWTAFTTVASPVNPGQVSGANMADMTVVHAFKKRLWFIEKNSMTAWYLPTDAVGGALTPFLLGSVFPRGGRLINIFSWSLDGGEGLDDVMIFQTSKGEIALYQGTDPSSAATWQLVSVYFVGAPLSERAICDFGADTLLLTTNGLAPVSSIVGGMQALTASQGVLSRNISRTLSRIIRDRNNSPGWELVNFPSLQCIVINFPDVNGMGSFQYVMNSLTGAWCKFDLQISTMGIVRESLFYADNSNRILLVTGQETVDDIPLPALAANLMNVRTLRYNRSIGVGPLGGDPTLGKAIITELKQAYNYFGKRGVNKHYNMIRPLFVSAYQPGVSIRLSTDFSPSGIYQNPLPPLVVPKLDRWDVAKWDEAFWSQESQTYYEWQGVVGLGYCASLIMKTATNVQTEFASVDWSYEQANSI